MIDADMLEPSEVYMNYGFTRIVYMDDIDELPTVDAEPVRHGYNTHKNTPSLFKCSLCGWFDSDTYTGDTHIYNYCPNCGAKMDG